MLAPPSYTLLMYPCVTSEYTDFVSDSPPLVLRMTQMFQGKGKRAQVWESDGMKSLNLNSAAYKKSNVG